MIKLDFDRFVEAQDMEDTYSCALEEIRDGNTNAHWMLYVFPRLKGLSMGKAARYYGISNLLEAQAYYRDELLGKRLRGACKVLFDNHYDGCIENIFTETEAQNLRASMTLFSIISPDDIFDRIIEVLFEEQKDEVTLGVLKKEMDFLYEDSPYEIYGIHADERAFMDGSCHEAHSIDPKQRMATLAGLVVEGYSLKELGYLYLYNHSDLLDDYRNSHLEITFPHMAFDFLLYMVDQFNKHKEHVLLAKLVNRFDVHTIFRVSGEREWEDVAEDFDRFVHFIRSDRGMERYLLKLLERHSLLRSPKVPQKLFCNCHVFGL